MRAAAVLSLLLAYRLGARLAGPLAGAVAALSLALSADLYRTALLGSAEPVLIALTLGAADRHLSGRRDWALVLIAVAGLIRPEAWVLLGAYGVFVWLREPGLRPLVAAAVRSAPGAVARDGLDRLGRPAARELDGDLGHRGQRRQRQGARVRGRAPRRRRGHPPHAHPRGVGVAFAVRRRDRPVLSLAALALGWIAVVAIMAEVGFTGTRRYLAAPAAALCVVAGVGLVWLLDAVRERRARIALGVAVAVLALVPALLRAREDARMLSVARSQADQRDELRARGRPRRRPRRGAAPRAPPRSTRGCRPRWPGSSTSRSRACRRPGRRRGATRTGRRRRSSSAPRRGWPGPRPALPGGVRTRRRDPLGALAGAARRGVSRA